MLCCVRWCGTILTILNYWQKCVFLMWYCNIFNPLNAKLNPVCHLLALLGAHHNLHVSRIRVNYF